MNEERRDPRGDLLETSFALRNLDLLRPRSTRIPIFPGKVWNARGSRPYPTGMPVHEERIRFTMRVRQRPVALSVRWLCATGLLRFDPIRSPALRSPAVPQPLARKRSPLPVTCLLSH